MILDLKPVIIILDELGISYERTTTWHLKCESKSFAINSYFNIYQLDIYKINLSRKLFYCTSDINELEEMLKFLMMMRK